jgi:ADP-ribosylglycohydrolase
VIVRYIDHLERLEFEIIQRKEEGRDVSALVLDFDKISTKNEFESRQRAYQLLVKLMNEEIYISEISREEPDDLLSIQNALDESYLKNSTKTELNESELYNKILGGWLGRSAGCLLGKPVERYSRPILREMLEANNNWPLDNYWTEKGMPKEILDKYPWKERGGLASLRENIEYMPEDDDLNYVMLNLHVMESFGCNFTSEDIGTSWLKKLPVLELFTAERVAYLNLLEGREPPESGCYMNPFREWIGAQIRADLWGYISPGKPKVASELAWKDARVSHSRNGIYGEMYFAALIANAFVESDIRTLVTSALAFIPKKSRFTQAIKTVLAMPITSMEWEAIVDEIYRIFGDYHWVHTINNAALTVAALLAGNGDYERSICYVVMGGWDTDSNGATVGSIIGVIQGAQRLPHKWILPLNNRIRSSLGGFDNANFDELAKRTFNVSQNQSKHSKKLNFSDDF